MVYPKRSDESWKPLYFFMPTMHMADHQTWHSITGIIVFVGITPVLWPSKCQGCSAILTYTAEFVAMWSAGIEEGLRQSHPVHVALLGHSSDEPDKPIW
jgi:hypothetical protein